MKRLLSLILVGLTAISIQADNKSLFITFNDNTRVEFALSTTPEVTVGDDKLTVASTATTASYDLWTVTSFTYGASTGISNTAQDNNILLQGDQLIVDGTNNRIGVFSIDGRQTQLNATTTGSKTLVNLNALPHGTYIIKVNSQSIKITRR